VCLPISKAIPYREIQSGDTIWRYNPEIQSGDTIWRDNLEIQSGDTIWRYDTIETFENVCLPINKAAVVREKGGAKRRV